MHFREMDYPVSEDGKGKKTVLKNAAVLSFLLSGPVKNGPGLL